VCRLRSPLRRLNRGLLYAKCERLRSIRRLAAHSNRKRNGHRSISLRTPESRWFLGAAEPRKLCIERRDGLRRSLGPGMEEGSGMRLRRGLSLQARTPVAGLSFAAAGADAPHLLGGLIKEEVGEVGHGYSFGMTIHPVEGTEKQAKWEPFCSLYLSCYQRHTGSAGPTQARFGNGRFRVGRIG
jgi:hypothetical protein